MKYFVGLLQYNIPQKQNRPDYFGGKNIEKIKIIFVPERLGIEWISSPRSQKKLRIHDLRAM